MPNLAGVAEVVGAVANIAGVKGLTDLVGSATGVNAIGEASLAGGGMTDEHFLSVMAAGLASVSGVPADSVVSVVKANYKSYVEDKDDLLYFQELGLVADPANLTKAEKQHIALFAMIVTVGRNRAAVTEGAWKATRRGLHSANNTTYFTQQGLIG